MLRSECDLKMHVRNLGYTLPVLIGAPKPYFGRLRNLTASLTDYVFETKHDVHNRASALATRGGLLHRLNML